MMRGPGGSRRVDRALARRNGFVQGPPIHVQRSQLNISPVMQVIRDRQTARLQFGEEAVDILHNGRPGLFPGMTGLYRNSLTRPLGQPNRAAIAPRAATEAETLRALIAYNRLKAATELVDDRLERNITVNEMWWQLNYNEWVLSQVARACVPSLPLSTAFMAAIISMATARRIFGPRFASTTYVTAAPSRPVPLAVGRAVDRIRQQLAFAGARPVPEAVMIRRDQLPTVFQYFIRNPAPAPRWR